MFYAEICQWQKLCFLHHFREVSENMNVCLWRNDSKTSEQVWKRFMHPLEQRHKSQLKLSSNTNTLSDLDLCLSLCAVCVSDSHRLMFSEHERIRVCPNNSGISLGYLQSSQHASMIMIKLKAHYIQHSNCTEIHSCQRMNLSSRMNTCWACSRRERRKLSQLMKAPWSERHTLTEWLQAQPLATLSPRSGFNLARYRPLYRAVNTVRRILSCWLR